jgi:hypothetical protein
VKLAEVLVAIAAGVWFYFKLRTAKFEKKGVKTNAYGLMSDARFQRIPKMGFKRRGM